MFLPLCPWWYCPQKGIVFHWNTSKSSRSCDVSPVMHLANCWATQQVEHVKRKQIRAGAVIRLQGSSLRRGDSGANRQCSAQNARKVNQECNHHIFDMMLPPDLQLFNHSMQRTCYFIVHEHTESWSVCRAVGSGHARLRTSAPCRQCGLRNLIHELWTQMAAECKDSIHTSSQRFSPTVKNLKSNVCIYIYT